MSEVYYNTPPLEREGVKMIQQTLTAAGKGEEVKVPENKKIMINIIAGANDNVNLMYRAANDSTPRVLASGIADKFEPSYIDENLIYSLYIEAISIAAGSTVNVEYSISDK